MNKCQDPACEHERDDAEDAYAVEADECIICFSTKANDFEQLKERHTGARRELICFFRHLRPGHVEEGSWDPINERTIHKLPQAIILIPNIDLSPAANGTNFRCG